jgi:hypothetical protein
VLLDDRDTMRAKQLVESAQHDGSKVLVSLELHHPHALFDLRIEKPADVNTARHLSHDDLPP